MFCCALRRHALTTIGLLIASALVAGCAVAPTPTPPTPGGPPAEPPVPAPSASATPGGPVALSDLELELVARWNGLDAPVDLTHAGDGSGRVFVAEQGGLVRVIKSGVLQGEPFLDLSSKTSASGERGLLGIAFSPTYETDGRVYVDYTDRRGHTVIERYTAPTPSSSSPKWGAPKRLLFIEQPYPNHNGGCLQFGPDGYLYIGMGDGGAGGDPGRRAQNGRVLLGKILRIDVSRAGAEKPYRIPRTNPSQFAENTALGLADEVWAIGMRNPWRFSFDAEDGTLWVADVGQNAWEEVGYITEAESNARAQAGGLNFGWPRYEGLHAYPSGKLVPEASRDEAYVWPTFDYSHPTGESITGGYVYRGRDFPALVGTYVFADYLAGWIAGIRLDAPDGTALSGREVRTLLETQYLPSSFGVDERGELYMLDHNGAVYQVTGKPR